MKKICACLCLVVVMGSYCSGVKAREVEQALSVSGSDSAAQTVGREEGTSRTSGGEISAEEEREGDIPAEEAGAGDMLAAGKTVSGSEPPVEGTTVSGNELQAGVEPIQDALPKGVMSFQVPDNLDFVMDPFEINGRGQIFSKEYYFSNLGSERIRVKLSAIQCFMAEGVKMAGEGEASQAVIESKEKVLQLQLIFGTGESITLTEGSGEYEMVLEPGQKIGLCIAGSMSRYPEISWESEDVRLALVYDVELIEEEPEQNSL